MKTIQKISGLDCIASLFLWKKKKNKKKHLFDEVVLLSIEKYLQGHLRRDEFRVGSYRKIQRHLSLGTSSTMALGRRATLAAAGLSFPSAHLQIKRPLLLHLLRLTFHYFANRSRCWSWSRCYLPESLSSRASLAQKNQHFAAQHSQSGQRMDSIACSSTLFLLDSEQQRRKPALRRDAKTAERLFFSI